MSDVPPAGRACPSPEAGSDGGAALRAALADGDETVFLALVSMHHPVLARVARDRLGDGGAAEAAVGATWLAFLDGLDDLGDEPVRGHLLALLDEHLLEGLLAG